MGAVAERKLLYTSCSLCFFMKIFYPIPNIINYIVQESWVLYNDREQTTYKELVGLLWYVYFQQVTRTCTMTFLNFFVQNLYIYCFEVMQMLKLIDWLRMVTWGTDGTWNMDWCIPLTLVTELHRCWKSASYLANKEVCCFSRNQNVHYRLHKCPPSVQSHFSPVQPCIC